MTLSIYLFTFGLSQLIWGPLVDHFGRRRLLPGSLILAIIATFMCVFAQSITMLIFGRALQGIAICCSNLIAYSTSRDFEDSLERARVLSYVSMIVSTSPILAPVLGSLVFTYLGWQANFLVMALIGFVILILSKAYLQESPFWTAPVKRFDLMDSLKAYKAILPSKVLWHGAAIITLTFTAVMLTIINSSFIIIDKLGFTPFSYGLIFIFNGLNMILGNYLGIWLRDRFSMTSTIYFGTLLIIVSGAIMLLSSIVYGFNLAVLSLALVANLGISVSAPPTMSLLLTDFKENAGVAIAFVNTMRMLVSAFLSFLVGFLIVNNILALPIGLLACGLASLGFARMFIRATASQKDDEMDVDTGVVAA